MKLTISDIEHIAELSRLNLEKEEKELYAEQLSIVLSYIENLNEIDTTGIAETCQVTGLEDITREDIALECDKEIRLRIIEQFPSRVGNLLKVKTVFT